MQNTIRFRLPLRYASSRVAEKLKAGSCGRQSCIVIDGRAKNNGDGK
jgi:hypothetical protein